MAIEGWIDEITRLWDSVGNGKGGSLKSYRCYEKDDFPEALNEFPCVITYTVDQTNMYSTGGPCIDLTFGRSEFHLTPDIKKHHMPYIMKFFKRIRNKAASSMALGGKVEFFMLRSEEGPSIEGPVEMVYGDESPHWGLIVHWKVKQNVTGDEGYTPAQ